MKIISQQQLIALLREIRGAKPATIYTVTEPKMNKKGNPYFGRVTKAIHCNVFINTNYANAVNKALAKEEKTPDFVPAERAWGERIAGTPLVEHLGNYYLECRFLNETKPVFMVDGFPYNKSVIEPFLPAKSAGTGRQGVTSENEVIIRTFKIDSIREIKFDKEHYQIV